MTDLDDEGSQAGCNQEKWAGPVPIPARTAPAAPAGAALSLSAGVFHPFSRTNFVGVHQNPAAGFIDFSARFWPGLGFQQREPLVAETVEWLLLRH